MERAIQEIEIVIMVRTNNILFIFVSINRSFWGFTSANLRKNPQTTKQFQKKKIILIIIFAF